MVDKFPYYRLYRAICASDYGRTLANNVRFGRFKPDILKNSTWEHILGPDVNNLKHMWFTKKLTDRFINLSPKQQFTPREQHLLRLTATFHDLAESIVGDVPKVLKNSTHEQQERVVLLQLVADMTQKSSIFKIAESELIYCIEHIIFPSVLTKMSRAFAAIEYLGYLHTACVAKTKAELRIKNNSTRTQLNLLTTEVTINSLRKLTTFSKQFSAIDKIIHQTQPYHDALFPHQSRVNSIIYPSLKTAFLS